MNPFLLPGADFLVFYLALSAVVMAVVVMARHLLGPAGRSRRRLTDPYAIALLRGGTEEAVRVAVASLIGRDLLTCSGRELHAREGAIDQLRDVAERIIVDACRKPIDGCALLRGKAGGVAFAPRRLDLEEQGLAPDPRLRLRWRMIAGVGLAVLVASGLAKLAVALVNGHHNLLFLIMLIVVTGLVVGRLITHLPLTTPRGRRVLGELESLFASLRDHPVAGRADESLFLAAVFGLTALPTSEWMAVNAAFTPRPQVNRSSDSSSSSGCGSGGSSCGSGGCGGGGCGGCGS